MAQLSQAFLSWLICFGLVSFGALIAVHLVLRKMRAAEKSSPTTGESDSPSGKPFAFSFVGRLLLVLIVAGFYLGVLGPLVGKVFAFLNATAFTQSSTFQIDSDGSYGSRLAGTSMELDSLGRPKLLPVPDPISAD